MHHCQPNRRGYHRLDKPSRQPSFGCLLMQGDWGRDQRSHAHDAESPSWHGGEGRTALHGLPDHAQMFQGSRSFGLEWPAALAATWSLILHEIQ
jgi:hypothetical protein